MSAIAVAAIAINVSAQGAKEAKTAPKTETKAAAKPAATKAETKAAKAEAKPATANKK